MKRIDFTQQLSNKIESLIENFTNNDLINFYPEKISVYGDIIDYDIDTDLINVHVKCIEPYPIDNEFNNEQLFYMLSVKHKSENGISFLFSEEDFEEEHLSLDNFMSENRIRYQTELCSEIEPNIFNDESLRPLFSDLAVQQRRKPENIMRECQKLIGGGILSNLLENIGDLTHRVSQSIYISSGDVHLGIYDINPKIENGIRILHNEEAFKKEVQRNRISNYNYNMENKENFGFLNYESFNNSCDKLINDYSKAHCNLTIYNEIQFLCKYSAVHLANGDYKKSHDHLDKLRGFIQDESYSKRASFCDENYEYQSLELLINKIKSKYKKEIKKLFIAEKNCNIHIHDIVINDSYRNYGIGTKIIEEISKYAKFKNSVITLEPNSKDLDYGTSSKSALVRFYKRSGFHENKGLNKKNEFNSGLMYNDFRKPEIPVHRIKIK